MKLTGTGEEWVRHLHSPSRMRSVQVIFLTWNIAFAVRVLSVMYIRYCFV